MNKYDKRGEKVFSTKINEQTYTLQKVENSAGVPMYVLLQDNFEMYSCYVNDVQGMLGQVGNEISPSLELQMRQALCR